MIQILIDLHESKNKDSLFQLWENEGGKAIIFYDK